MNSYAVYNPANGVPLTATQANGDTLRARLAAALKITAEIERLVTEAEDKITGPYPRATAEPKQPTGEGVSAGVGMLLLDLEQLRIRLNSLNASL